MLNQDLQSQLRQAGYKGGFLLGELMKACGDKLNGSTIVNIVDKGETSEVVVAKLWLKLNLLN